LYVKENKTEIRNSVLRAPSLSFRSLLREITVQKIMKNWANRLAVVLIICAVASGIATYAALNEVPPLGNDPDTIIWLLNLDLIFVLGLVALIARRITRLWSGRKRGIAGSHLHVRLVYIFSILAAVPAITMTVFSAFFFHFGVQTWFSQRVQTAINESQAVAQAYLEEHTQVIRADTLAMANDLNRQADLFMANEPAFEKILNTQSVLRNSAGRVYARSGLTFSLEFEEVPQHILARARGGEVAIVTGASDDRVRALVKLDNFVDSYLFVGRMIDPKVLSHLAATERATQDYLELQDKYSSLQVTVTLIFVVVGLLLLVIAIWFGLLLSRQLVKPISALITTADQVRAGDLAARVPEDAGLEEFEYLAHAFNRMTTQIQEQQNALIDANKQLDRRRHFTETVLTGVSSGVIGVDQGGCITVANSSAYELLGLDAEGVIGREMEEVLPELSALLALAHTRVNKVTQGEIPIKQADHSKLIFLVRIAIELIGDQETGAIVTFDDITDLQAAQRKAAWSDVARRIAHEIKNPLTPIQLSAERLKRRYLKQIADDPETFVQCTDTIIKHVEDIGHMVNEFSAFARMPEPSLKFEDIHTQVSEALVLYKQAHSAIDIAYDYDKDAALHAYIDAQQIRQVLSNLLQNAVDSIAMRQEQGDGAERGHIEVTVGTREDEQIFIAVTDDGIGFPENEDISRLTEPYVTHKQKGTGLGLAIVKKIMGDHNGSIILGAPEWLQDMGVVHDLKRGAAVVLTLPLEKQG
jgi:two-component system nitrogen regulation sensor histidine kinase NtrY